MLLVKHMVHAGVLPCQVGQGFRYNVTNTFYWFPLENEDAHHSIFSYVRSWSIKQLLDYQVLKKAACEKDVHHGS